MWTGLSKRARRRTTIGDEALRPHSDYAPLRFVAFIRKLSSLGTWHKTSLRGDGAKIRNQLQNNHFYFGARYMRGT
jgi:hypothetical protein